MKFLATFVVTLSTIALLSCSNCKESQSENNRDAGKPTSIALNMSIVEAEVIEVSGDDKNFKVKTKVLSVEENSSFPSIAVVGEEYLLTPNFRTEDGKVLNNEINSNLSSLRKLSKGQKFKAEISLDQNSGWLIQKVLK